MKKLLNSFFKKKVFFFLRIKYLISFFSIFLGSSISYYSNCVESDFVTQRIIFDTVFPANANALEHFRIRLSSER